MYNSIPVLIIFAAIVVVVVVVARRLPDIAAINTESIPEARAAATKRRLLRHRLERKLQSAWHTSWQATSRLRSTVAESAARAHERLLVLERRYRAPSVKSVAAPTLQSEQSLTAAPSSQPTLDPSIEATSLDAANASLENNLYDEAEHQYLEAIRQDHRNAAAYRGLGSLYHKKRQIEEARQALEYALQLAKEAATYAALGALCVDEDKLQEAEDHYKEAAKLNPKVDYLDQLIEVCILVGDKRVAQTTLIRLQGVEPTYPRLDDLGQRVAALPLRRKRSNGKR